MLLAERLVGQAAKIIHYVLKSENLVAINTLVEVA